MVAARRRVRTAIGVLAFRCGAGLLAAAGVIAAGDACGGQSAVIATAQPAQKPAAGLPPAAVVRVHTLLERDTARAHVSASAPRLQAAGWTAFAWVHGRPAAWLADGPSVTLMRFEQGLIHLDLHAGSVDGGVVGWRYGDQITAREAPFALVGFNGGFKLNYGGGRAVGFEANGRVAVPLKRGLASVVTYSDGTTDIAAWRRRVPDPRRRVFSVLQNLRLLVDGGVAAATIRGCVVHCWGVTITNHADVARSGLGITAAGQLVWAAGERLSPAELAEALIRAGAVRAIELDINPHWVAAYRYTHSLSGTTATPVVPGQQGVLGQFFTPYSRDFFVVVG